jgi:hypothetical protein
VNTLHKGDDDDDDDDDNNNNNNNIIWFSQFPHQCLNRNIQQYSVTKEYRQTGFGK